MEAISWKINKYKRASGHRTLSTDNMDEAMRFHQSMPGYSSTPLRSLSKLAAYLQVDEILVKDESYRFGLNSFKVLGSSYALAKILTREWGVELDSFSGIKERIKTLPKHTFASATAGNHGRGLAWTAKLLDQKAVIYLPKGSSMGKLHKLQELGARAEITNLNYDDTVRYVSQISKQNGWIVVQDTAWKGYTEIPNLIMQGYLTMVAECLQQFREMGKKAPTHVILQAGVGSFAAAIAEGLQQNMEGPITFIIAEPSQADSFFQSCNSIDGKSKKASGNLSTMMSGLACAEANPIAWEALKNLADCFVSCPDSVAAKGMRILGSPLEGDARIISGESGAVPLGLLFEMCTNPELKELKESLKINSGSRFLMISTEGDTDPENYRNICWGIKTENLE